MNYLLHIIIRVRFVRTCAQNNNYNNNKENKKKVLACVLTTRTTNPSLFFCVFYRISQTFLPYFIVFYLKIICILSEFK